MMIVGDADRLHLEEDRPELPPALRQDDHLHRYIPTVLAWLDPDLDHLPTRAHDRTIHAHHDLRCHERDLRRAANDHRLGSHRLLAASLIEREHRPLLVRIIVGVVSRRHQVNHRLVPADIAMAVTIANLQLDLPVASVNHRKCHLQPALPAHRYQCLHTIDPIPQYCLLQLVHVVHPLVALMALPEISLPLHLDEVDLEVHHQGHQVMTLEMDPTWDTGVALVVVATDAGTLDMGGESLAMDEVTMAIHLTGQALHVRKDLRRFDPITTAPARRILAHNASTPHRSILQVGKRLFPAANWHLPV